MNLPDAAEIARLRALLTPELLESLRAVAEARKIGHKLRQQVQLSIDADMLLALATLPDVLDAMQEQVRVLRSAIGVMVPTILRCYLQVCPERSPGDVEPTQNVLDRVETAMAVTEAIP